MPSLNIKTKALFIASILGIAAPGAADALQIKDPSVPKGCKRISDGSVPGGHKWNGVACVPGGGNACACKALLCGRKVSGIVCEGY